MPNAEVKNTTPTWKPVTLFIMRSTSQPCLNLHVATYPVHDPQYLTTGGVGTTRPVLKKNSFDDEDVELGCLKHP